MVKPNGNKKKHFIESILKEEGKHVEFYEVMADE